MSWEDYVSNQLTGTGNVKKGAICGLDGSCWAKSPDWGITTDECSKIAKSFNDSAGLSMTGIKLGGEKYFFLSASDDIIRGRSGKTGIHVVKTKSAIIYGLYEEPVQPNQCAVAVENLADYLRTNNL